MRLGTAIFVVLVLGGGWVARADLVCTCSEAPASPRMTTPRGNIERAVNPPIASTSLFERAGLTPFHLAHPLTLDGSRSSETDERVVPLPPGPSSLALTFSALLSMSVFQAGRSIRKLHMSHLPEWYHAESPLQIGHATRMAADLSLPSVDTPLSALDAPAPASSEPTCSSRQRTSEPCAALSDAAHLSILRPRPPPTSVV